MDGFIWVCIAQADLFYIYKILQKWHNVIYATLHLLVKFLIWMLFKHWAFFLM